MIYRKPRTDEWNQFESLARHPLQSKAWGDFRETTGVEVIRLVGFDDKQMKSQLQLTVHPVPKFGVNIGYFPKGQWPDEIQLHTLRELGKQQKMVFIKLEPDISSPPLEQDRLDELRQVLISSGCQLGRAMFTPYSFLVDLKLSETELMKRMKSKTRYNIRVAQKHEVKVLEDSSDAGFEEYLHLLELTTKRQQFYAHDKDYQQNMWKYMSQAGIAKILKATYQDQTVAAWILFLYKNTLYYPYGASSRDHREVMASNLLMWEAMRFGKANGCGSFDMWGSLGPHPDQHDPWYGFHRFKEGYGGELAHFVGSYDLVIDPPKYKIYRQMDNLRWKWLRLRAKLPF